MTDSVPPDSDNRPNMAPTTMQYVFSEHFEMLHFTNIKFQNIMMTQK
jgi:hypothetical protein